MGAEITSNAALEHGAPAAGPARGRLKVFLGYASGVGKSRRLFEEARRRRDRGQDVVVGAVQRTYDPAVSQLLDSLEIIPLLDLNGIAAMDTAAILNRRPQICVVDGLAYDNPPGAAHLYRWQDVDHLLAAGISVLTSVNIQYIAEQREAVERLSGKHVTETVPEHFVISADEIVLVDVPSELSAQNAEDVDRDLESRERAGRLAKLRELALLLTASVLDQSLNAYLRSSGIDLTWRTQERILIYLRPNTNSRRIVEAARRNSDRFHGELAAVYVRRGKTPPSIEEGVALASGAGAHVTVLEGSDPEEAVLRFAREQRVTQIFVGQQRGGDWLARWFGTPVGRLVRLASEIDVRVIPG
jgi:two-component system sensor histidine kinase KdpD